MGATIHAQTCDPEADFTFTPDGCVFSFQSSFTGQAVHQWQFFRNPQGQNAFSSSNLINPTHSFAQSPTGLTTRLVTHTIKFTNANGQTVTKTCSKVIPVTCTLPCTVILPNYQVVDCQLSLLLSEPSLMVDWGDGTPVQTGINLQHTYQTGGIFQVTYTNFSGVTCTVPISVNCGGTPCCTADFVATITRNCAKLSLTLDASCNSGIHQWSIAQGCFKVYTLNATLADQVLQITDIDTDVTSSITLTHKFTCANGQVLTQTKTIPVLSSGEKGVFIGVEGTTTKLSLYNCTMPGITYSGQANKPVYVSGLIEISKNFTYSGTDLQFAPGVVGFDIFSQVRLTLNNATVARGVQDAACNLLWRGIMVYTVGRLTCDNVTIRDALFAIRIFGAGGAITSLNRVTFLENFVGINATKSFGKFTITRSTFDGGTSLRNAGTLLNLANTSIVVHNPNPNLLMNYMNLVFKSDRGVIGIYSQTANLTLPDISNPADRNRFTRLNYGILMHDADLTMSRNAQFRNFSAAGYDPDQVVGIAIYDRSGSGNKILIEGALTDNNAELDISNVLHGIYIRSQNIMSSTLIGIKKMNMDPVRTGILLDANFMGTFVGNSNTITYTGIQWNRVRASLDGTLIYHYGIGLTDASPTESNVEIYNNEVLLEYGIPTPDCLPLNRSAGIAAVYNFWANTFTNAVESDIHDNRVVVTGRGQIGILNMLHNGVVRNNNGGSFASGNGVFIDTPAPIESWGIVSSVGYNHKIRCNDVQSAAGSNPESSHLYIRESANCFFQRNTLTGPGRGVHFEEPCPSTTFRCNTMAQNNIGMYYGLNAITEPQGSGNDATGNIWNGPFVEFQALHEGGPALAYSQYFVRPIQTGTNIEQPTNISPNLLWFRTSTAAQPTCFLDGCPAPPGLTGPPDVSATDIKVANNTLDYSETQKWNLRLGLYQKLFENPSLTLNNPVMDNFKNTMSGTPIASFIPIQSAMRNLFQPSSALKVAVGNNNVSMETLQSGLNTLDVAISSTTDAAQLENLVVQRAQKDSLLDLLVTANEQLGLQYLADMGNSATVLQGQLSAIVPNNIYETNLKSVIAAFLSSIPMNTAWNEATRLEIKAIAEQYSSEGGIGVGMANSLYHILAVRDLAPTECGGKGKAREAAESPTTTPTATMDIYPNPSDGMVYISIPEQHQGKYATFTVYTVTGTIVKETAATLDTSTMIFDLSQQTNGTYFLTVRIGDKEIQTTPIIIR